MFKVHSIMLVFKYVLCKVQIGYNYKAGPASANCAG